jgi:hypothetical protein
MLEVDACRATCYQLAISEGPQVTDVNKADKHALDYLRACGLPICIIETDGACTFRAGSKIDPNALAVYWAAHGSASSEVDWFSETQESDTVAAAVVKTARQLAGKAPEAATADAALHRSAAVQPHHIDPHAAMMGRAASAVKDIDAYLESWRKSGQLSVFNGRYKRERAAATASGRNFMTYPQALARLRRVLIPIMATRVQQGVGTLFEQMFPEK